MNKPRTRVTLVLRIVLVINAVVFLTASLFNFGLHVPLGFADLSFPLPVWQAGIGEAVIGLALLAAAVTGRSAMAWVAFWLSVVGIAFGLSSARVQGPAREIHLVLVPLAVVVFGLLLWLWAQRHWRDTEALGPGAKQ
ncbi:MAG TPA: hypothetical protein VFU88_02000 [Ktedonobacterales bacterium]|nr:hypothetical protein [Ktedonobacterales bacterium]